MADRKMYDESIYFLPVNWHVCDNKRRRFCEPRMSGLSASRVQLPLLSGNAMPPARLAPLVQ
jgi:hypothetical protein